MTQNPNIGPGAVFDPGFCGDLTTDEHTTTAADKAEYSPDAHKRSPFAGDTAIAELAKKAVQACRQNTPFKPNKLPEQVLDLGDEILAN